MFELVDSAQHAADCALQHGQRILEAQEKAPSGSSAVGKKSVSSNKGEICSRSKVSKVKVLLDTLALHPAKTERLQDAWQISCSKTTGMLQI